MPARVPQADSRHGDLHHLPLPDDHVDLVVCALALTHLPELAPAIAEFARVLRPGGHLVISDVHHVRVEFGSVPRVRGPAGEPGLLAAHRHLASDYLTAALPLGLQVRRCVEPFIPVGDGPAPPRDVAVVVFGVEVETPVGGEVSAGDQGAELLDGFGSGHASSSQPRGARPC